MTLANALPAWMAGGQWWLLAILWLLGAALVGFGLARRRLRGGARRCPACRYDMRSTPSLVCGECGHEAPGEARLRLGGRRWLIIVLGAVVALGYPAYRGAAWSRARGWTPPLPAWRAVEEHALPNGAVVAIIEPRHPQMFGRACVVEPDRGASIHLSGIQFTIRAAGLGADITGDGTPNLVVEAYSGGAHCCTTFHVFGLEDDGRVTVLAEIDARDGGGFEDRDDDGALEFVTRDWSLAYALSCFACIEYPEVVLRWTGAGYVPAPDLMWRPAPTAAEFETLVATLRDGAMSGAPDALWSAMLGLIYTGHDDLAWRLADRAWPATTPERDSALANFRTVLAKSPYREPVREVAVARLK